MKINSTNIPLSDRAKIINHDRFFCESCGSYYDDYRRQDAEEDEEED